MQKLVLYILFHLFFCVTLFAKNDSAVQVYLFPGQGADYRLFNNIEIPSEYNITYMHLPVPDKGESLNEYAQRFIPEIDTSRKFVLIGVSLGGMICTELSTILHPEKVIIISSAKCWHELPKNYTFQRKFKINRIIPKSYIKFGAVLLQPIVEPDSRSDRAFFTSMLSIKDPKYLKRTIDMIINWERETIPEGIFHIHGTADNTIPYENVTCNYTIKDGSHMMAYTRGEEISRVIKAALSGEFSE